MENSICYIIYSVKPVDRKEVTVNFDLDKVEILYATTDLLDSHEKYQELKKTYPNKFLFTTSAKLH